MKALLFACLLGIFPFTPPLEAQTLSDSETTTLTQLKGTFVPRGFVEGERVQFATYGTFSNSCYRLGPHALRVDQTKKWILLQQQAYRSQGNVCLQVFIPFANIIEAGELTAGDYKIMDIATNKEIGTLVISKPEVGPKPRYAKVTEAEVNSQNLDTNLLTIKGEFEDRCTLIKEVLVEYQENVIVAKPMVESSGTRCVIERNGFSRSVELRSDVKGIFLLHVKSGNGLAVNKIIEFK